MRGRLKAWRHRIDMHSRRRWTDHELHEVELAAMGAAMLIGIMALLVVMGRRG